MDLDKLRTKNDGFLIGLPWEIVINIILSCKIPQRG